VLPREHRLAQRQTLQAADLRDETFILFPRPLGAYLFDQIAAICRNAGFTLHVAQEAVHLTTIVGLVAAGMGVSILPTSVMALAHADVVYHALPEAAPVTVSAIYRGEPSSPVLNNFMAVLRSLDQTQS
jgi:DNA-binding transcriptional LysR family regulator